MRIKNQKLSIAFKIIICLIGLFSIITNIGLFTNTINYKLFTMFTTLSNIFCVFYFLFDVIYLIKNYNDDSKIVWCSTIKGIVTMSITVTFLVALFILKMKVSFTSFQSASFLGLHFIIPIMSILDWLLFDQKGLIHKSSPFIWLILPYMYFFFAIISVQFGFSFGMDGTSKYPYPFLDIDALGLSKVILIIIILTIFFLILGFIYYGIDRFLYKKSLTKDEK